MQLTKKVRELRSNQVTNLKPQPLLSKSIPVSKHNLPSVRVIKSLKSLLQRPIKRQVLKRKKSS